MYYSFEDIDEEGNVSTTFTFKGLNSGKYKKVEINVHMKGSNFDFIADLSHFDQVILR